jgi:hypothetical protein
MRRLFRFGRHSAATARWDVFAGVGGVIVLIGALTGDLALVSELAGHASPATTKRYDRRPAENRRRAARSLHMPY